MPAHYDDPNYNYQVYWKNRKYEHQSEVIAIEKMLNGKKFTRIADVGGGFGRLFPILSQYSQKITLLEPSSKLRNLAKKNYPKIFTKYSLSHNIPFRKNSFDLICMIRVSHHLTTLAPTFEEINRVLKPNGYYLLEIANSLNFKNRLKHLFSPIPKVPIERRSKANIRKKTIAFVNHHPNTVIKDLTNSGFTIEKILSVSNFRSPLIKQILPMSFLLMLEAISQRLLARFFFGPSLFLLAKKAS